MVHMVDGGKEGNITCYSVQQSSTNKALKLKIRGLDFVYDGSHVTVSNEITFRAKDWVAVEHTGDIILHLKYINPLRVMLGTSLSTEERVQLLDFFKKVSDRQMS